VLSTIVPVVVIVVPCALSMQNGYIAELHRQRAGDAAQSKSTTTQID
jgi:hypothetical protein